MSNQATTMRQRLKGRAAKPDREEAPGARNARTMSAVPRRWGQLAAGVGLVAAAAIGGALVLQSAGDRESVVTVGGDVAQGQTIEASDLATADVAGVGGTFASSEADTLVGRTAAVDLKAGQVLTEAQVTDTPVPGPGAVLVGLNLTPSQMPGAGIEEGDQVQVVGVSGADSGSEELEEATVLASSALVYAVSAGDVNSGQGADRRVTVVAPEEAAGRMTAYAAAGRVAIVEIAPGQ